MTGWRRDPEKHHTRRPTNHLRACSKRRILDVDEPGRDLSHSPIVLKSPSQHKVNKDESATALMQAAVGSSTVVIGFFMSTKANHPLVTSSKRL